MVNIVVFVVSFAVTQCFMSQ